MSKLRLAKLPERTLIKVAIAVSPSLNERLEAYARLYEQTYGKAEPLSELIPAMLTGFLDSDRAFRPDAARRES